MHTAFKLKKLLRLVDEAFSMPTGKSFSHLLIKQKLINVQPKSTNKMARHDPEVNSAVGSCVVIRAGLPKTSGPNNTRLHVELTIMKLIYKLFLYINNFLTGVWGLGSMS